MNTSLPLYYVLRKFSYVFESMWPEIFQLWEVPIINFTVGVWIIEGSAFMLLAVSWMLFFIFYAQNWRYWIFQPSPLIRRTSAGNDFPHTSPVKQLKLLFIHWLLPYFSGPPTWIFFVYISTEHLLSTVPVQREIYVWTEIIAVSKGF